MLPLLMFNVIAETIKDNLKGLMNLPNSQSDSSSSVYFVNFNQDCTFKMRREEAREIGPMIVFFIFLTFPLDLCAQSVCPRYKHLIKDNCAGCGICQEDRNTGKIMCFYDKIGYFYGGKNCNPVLFCNRNENVDKCKPFGCLSMLGTFRCKCGLTTFGRLCEYNRIEGLATNSFAVINDIIFTPIRFLGEYTTVTLIFSNIGKQLEVEVITSFEIQSYNSDLCEEVSKNKLCKKWYKDYPDLCERNANIQNNINCAITLQFVFQSLTLEDEDDIHTIHNDNSSHVFGLIQNIKVEIYNNKLPNPVFKNLYRVVNMIESPYIHGCDPTLEVRNAGYNTWDAFIFTVRDEIVITSSYQLNPKPKCRQVDNIMLHWIVWKIYVNHEEQKSTPFREVFKDINLYFPAFSLDKGLYKTRLNISVWSGSKESYAFVDRYFKVVELELLPVISGGEERTVYFNVEFLKLEGSLSRDPNLVPSKQKGSLQFYWKCDKPIDLCKVEHTGDSIVYPGPFTINETYIFYLTVISNRDTELQATTSQRIRMSSTIQYSIEILCKKNCGGIDYQSNPGNAIYLVAVITSNSLVEQVNTTFDWTYSNVNEEDYKAVDGIRQSNTPDEVLIVIKNSLSDGESYWFQVKGKTTNLGIAKFIVKMASKVPAFSCSPDVSFGNSTISRGVTKFKVVCDKLDYNRLAPIYDFYDRNVDDRDDSGRLIASGKSNIAFDVVLTRGKLVVEVTNEYGIMGVSELVATLQKTTNVTEIVQEKLENLKRNGSTSDAEFRINTLSVILDLVATKTHNVTNLTHVIEYMLKIASEDEISSIPVLKVWTSLVNTIAKENVIKNLNTKSVNYLSKAITKLSRKLLYEVREGINETEINDLTSDVVHKLCQSILKICNAICNSWSEDLIGRRLSEEETYSLHVSYRESSSFLVRAVGRIMLSLALTILPYESPIMISENCISIWIKEDNPESFSIDSVPSVVISTALARSISHTSNMIIVQVAEYGGNPYWYNSEFKIHTHAVDLQVRFKKGDLIPFVSEIVDKVVINLQQFETETIVINGSVCQPDSYKSLDIADKAVAIHQVRVPYTGRMVLKFLDLEEDHYISVKVLFNLRPDYEFMTEKNIDQVTKFSPTLYIDLKDPHSHDVYDLYYIGILPGIKVPKDKCFNYSFEMSVLHCVTWKFHEWSTGGCRVKATVDSRQLQCECEHLSTFAGFSRVPVNSIDPFSDYSLFITLTDNPFVFIFLVALLSIYFILLIWALRKDRKEKLKGGAIYLEDNFPRDPFPYLVAVYTGNKLFSGTTSNVGIMIEGEEAGSRPHLLTSSSYRLLETGDDNWFIIFTPYQLGDLTMIHLWMDYSGKSPDWYCHKVMIVDLVTFKEYLFLVDTWMSLKDDEFIERFVEVSKTHGDEHLFNTTVDNLVLGFRETHLWASVLVKHPRSSVTRAQRLSLAFTGLLVTMLVSCLFYGVLDERKEDYSSFTLSVREFVIAVLSMIISSALINTVVSLFRRSLVLKNFDEEYMLEVDEGDENIEKKSKKKMNVKSKTSNTLRRFFEDVLKVLTKPKKFKPVILNIDEIVKVNRKTKIYDICWLLLSWSICIIMICMCFYLIALYGLKFGKVKSLEWLSSVGFSLIQIVFLVAPLRIISIATLSGMLSSNLYKLVSYRIQPQLLEKCKLWQLNSDPNLDSNLINIRSQKLYIPLSYIEATRKFYKQRRRVATWLLLDMVFILVLVVLMFIQNETLWSTKYYWNNQQLTTLLRQVHEEEGVQLYSLTNLSIYSIFLEKDVFPVIYQSKWYNGLPIEDNNSEDGFRFVFGGTSKLFGLPRLRQIRLKPDLCKKPIYENLSQYCNVKLTEDTEDTNLYAEGWVETGPREKFQKLSPWSYLNVTETYDMTLLGYSSIAYKGDGYVAELDMSEEKAEDIVNTLNREKWLDRRTCVVIFELTLYNAFTGTFSWLISVTENLHIGVLMNRVYVFTVSDSYDYPIVDFVFFLGFFMFAVRVFFVVNSYRIDKLLHSFWNIFDIIIVCLALSCAVFYIINIYLRSEYLSTVLSGDTRENYFQYFHMLEYLREFRTILLFLVITLVCRSIKSFKFGNSFSVYFNSVIFDWNRIIWIFVILTLFLYTHWRIFSYLMNNFTLSKSNFLIISKVDFKIVVATCSNVHCKISPFLLCSVSYFVQLIIISHLVFTFRIVKRKFSEKEQLNFCKVFCDKNSVPIVMKDTKRK